MWLSDVDQNIGVSCSLVAVCAPCIGSAYALLALQSHAFDDENVGHALQTSDWKVAAEI